MLRVKVALATCLILILAILGITLTGSPIAVSRLNTTAHKDFLSTTKPVSACQSGEVLPRHTTAVRLQAFAASGPRVTVRMLEGGRLIAHGEHESGWTGGVVTVPLKSLATTRSGVTVCFAFLLNGSETIALEGESATGALAAHGHGGALPGRLGLEYMQPSPSSWWSAAPQVLRRMGLGRAWSGPGIVILALLTMVAVMALSARLLLKELT
jgi:hypothetical protein